MGEGMKIRANAKINLSLCINGKRADGYHLIDTVMHSIDLCDILEIEKAEQISLVCKGCDIPQEENIAYKAAKLFFQDYGIAGGADILLEKHIPAPAGLGGGSADAAAVLVALNKLYDAKIPNKDLEKTALKLGADVPFFIEGGCKRAEGIGEIFTNVTPLDKGYILLAKAEKKPSTAEMYRMVDGEEPIAGDTDAVIDAVKTGDLQKLGDNLFNSFTCVWKNSFVKRALLEQEPLAVSLSGSGPTWFAIFDDLQKAQEAKLDIEHKGISCWVTRLCEKSIIFE